jgi:hypothetical protein
MKDDSSLAGIAADTGSNPEVPGFGPVPQDPELEALNLATQRLVGAIQSYPVGWPSAMSDSDPKMLTDAGEAALLLGVNPEAVSMGALPPFLRLAGLVLAAREVVREVRRCFPVAGKTWAFEGCESPGALKDAVGWALIGCEGWVNPHNLPYGSPERRDPDVISGLPEGRLGIRPLLRETVRALLYWYDLILQHYGVEDEVAARGDLSLLWWPLDVHAIDGELLDGLEQAADRLMELLEQEGYQRFLGCEPGPERRTDEAPPQTGHLGLILDDSERTVRRQGRAACVQFGDAELGWKLLRALVRAGGQRLSLPDLRREVWESNTQVGDNAIHKLASLLRAALKPIGINPHPLRKLGYRLEDVAESE